MSLVARLCSTILVLFLKIEEKNLKLALAILFTYNLSNETDSDFQNLYFILKKSSVRKELSISTELLCFSLSRETQLFLNISKYVTNFNQDSSTSMHRTAVRNYVTCFSNFRDRKCIN